MQAHQGGQVIDTHTTNPICMSCFFASKRSIEFMPPGWTISYSIRSFVIELEQGQFTLIEIIIVRPCHHYHDPWVEKVS